MHKEIREVEGIRFDSFEEYLEAVNHDLVDHHSFIMTPVGSEITMVVLRDGRQVLEPLSLQEARRKVYGIQRDNGLKLGDTNFFNFLIHMQRETTGEEQFVWQEIEEKSVGISSAFLLNDGM